MKTNITNRIPALIGTKTREIIIDLIIYLFILLFVYTASSKLYGFKDFDNVLYFIPVFGSAHFIIAILIISLQLIIAALLIIPSTKSIGLSATLALLIIFTVFLAYMIFFATVLPCNCAGITSRLSWKNQTWLNILLIVIVSFGILTNQYKKQQL